MTTELQILRELPRTTERIYREFEAAQKHLNALCDLAAECINTQLPPIRWSLGGTVEPVTYEIPENLRTAIRDAAEEKARLEYELVSVMRASHAARLNHSFDSRPHDEQ